MRSFIISLILLAIVITAVIANSVYGAAVYGKMLYEIEQLPSEIGKNNDLIEKTASLFEQHKRYIYHTNCEGTANDLFCDFAEASAYFYAGDVYSYRACREKTKFRVKSLLDAELNFISEFILENFDFAADTK